MYKKNTPLIPLALALAISTSAHAQDKHVHGEAELFIAMENNTVLVEMDSAAANIIGFEHEPRTSQQHAALGKALEQLQHSESIIQLPESACQLKEAKVTSPFNDDEHSEHKEHAHDDHGHDDHKKHKKHKKHADHHEHDDHKKHAKHDGHDDHHDHHHDEEVHSDFHVNYQLECQNIKAIKQITITAFDHFPALEKMNVHWVTAESQGAAPATPKAKKVTLK